MNKFYLSWWSIVLGFNLFAQAPESFKYQSVVRDGIGEIVSEQAISFRISIVQSVPFGITLYSEIDRSILGMSFWHTDERAKSSRKTFSYKISSFDPTTGKMTIDTKTR